MRTSRLSNSPGLQPHRGRKGEGLHGANHQFLDVGWIPPSQNMCQVNGGETSPHLWATKGGRLHGWKETAALAGGWISLAQGLAVAFADVSAQRVHNHCLGVCQFDGFFPPKTSFHHSPIWLFLLGDNVKIINTLRRSSLTFARFMDTGMAGTIYPKALVTGSGPSWNTCN